jgi:hypothetical protein
MTDPIALVTEAVNPKTFSVLDAAKNRSYPQDIVDVYTDAESAYQVNRLERKINDATDNDDLEALSAQQEDYRAKVKASVLTFRLRGINPGMIRSLSEEAKAKFPDDENKQNEWSNFSILAAHVVDVTDADGNVDDHKWDHDDVVSLRDWVPDEEFDKIADLMLNLSFAAQLFDVSVTPDFSLA